MPPVIGCIGFADSAQYLLRGILCAVHAKLTGSGSNSHQHTSDVSCPRFYWIEIMFLKLFAAFVIIPLIELYLLVQLSFATGLGTTIAIVITTGILGSMLARREGTIAWVRFQQALAEGRMPSREIQDGLMVVFAAALLLTPGLLTDFLGFTLLVPPGRALIRKYVLSRYMKGFQVHVGPGFGPGSAFDPPNDFADDFANDEQTIDAKAVHRN